MDDFADLPEERGYRSYPYKNAKLRNRLISSKVKKDKKDNKYILNQSVDNV